MNVQFKYAGQSGIISGLTSSRVAFATNQLREATYFHGVLRDPLPLRDGLDALHEVVISDLKYRPRDREAFRAWLAEQDRKFLAGLAVKSEEIRRDIDEREARLAELDAELKTLRAPFDAARRAYFDYAYTRDYELSYVLDPVVTVHPDELSFEAFSRDESSYARVAIRYDLFSRIDAFEPGTTNVDFSQALHRQFARMRSYRDTRLDVDPSGLTVTNPTDGVHREKQIELPESWVNGFHQVQSTMTLGLTRIRLAPIDLFNLCRFLTRHRAHTSPRALRWELTPGQPARAVLEPWEHAITLSPVAIYTGDKEQRIRTWGRDRLRVLHSLLPATDHIDLYLAGHGLPTFYVCSLGDVSFTLGLSGWTEQDWSGTARFDLLTRRLDATPEELTTTYTALREVRYARAEELAGRTGLGVEKTRACLSLLCQVGRAMFDLSTGTYRHRDLFYEPFSAAKAIARAKQMEEESNPQAIAAKAAFEAGQARLIARRPVKTGFKLSGSVRGSDDERVRPLLSVDHEGQILDATCTCKFFRTHKLTRGPCEHVLALRLAHMARLEAEDAAAKKGG